MTRSSALAVACVVGTVLSVAAQQSGRIYWDDQVPPGWNGKWPAKYLTVPEKTAFTRTTSTIELHEFVDVLKWTSDKVHVFWDPVLFFDAHLMGRVKHGYANADATSTVPAAHPAPREYV